MARKTKVVVVCDKHRGEVEAVGSIEISIDGDRRSLDLCAEHLAELRKAMRPWLRQAPASTSTSPRGRSRSGTKKASGRRPTRSADAAAVRQWARENGYDVPARGRIPGAVREAFTAAQTPR
jgi:hypothetical protein